MVMMFIFIWWCGRQLDEIVFMIIKNFMKLIFLDTHENGTFDILLNDNYVYFDENVNFLEIF